jgi:hypothetical protein
MLGYLTKAKFALGKIVRGFKLYNLISLFSSGLNEVDGLHRHTGNKVMEPLAIALSGVGTG